MDRNKKFFVSGGKTDIIDTKFTPMSVGDTYVDPWANPMTVRGVPKDQNELLESAYHRKAFFATPPEVPFLTRTGGNNSVSQPNDLFEIIAEAQQTGGVLQRHLGNSMRFGVPDNYDYRPIDGTAPMLPPRSSSLRVTRPK